MEGQKGERKTKNGDAGEGEGGDAGVPVGGGPRVADAAPVVAVTAGGNAARERCRALAPTRGAAPRPRPCRSGSARRVPTPDLHLRQGGGSASTDGTESGRLEAKSEGRHVFELHSEPQQLEISVVDLSQFPARSSIRFRYCNTLCKSYQLELAG